MDFKQLLNPKSKPLIGVDIGHYSVKMVELSKNSSGYKVEKYAVEPLPKNSIVDGNFVDQQAIVDVVAKTWKKLNTSVKDVAICLPASSVIMKKVYISKSLRGKDFEGQIELEAQQYIPFPMSEINLDYSILDEVDSANSEEYSVLLVGAKKEFIEERVAIVESAGLKAVIVDIEANAQLRSLNFFSEINSNEIVAVIDIGSSLMKTNIYKDGFSLFNRDQNLGGNTLTEEIARQYGMDFSDSEASKKNQTLPDNYNDELLQPFVNNLVLEIARSLQFFYTSSQYGKVDRVLLVGGGVMLPEFVEQIKDRLDSPVELVNPFSKMSLSDKISAKNLILDASSMIVCCGLALRRFEQ